jgi:hypothetical protein
MLSSQSCAAAWTALKSVTSSLRVSVIRKKNMTRQGAVNFIVHSLGKRAST